jgi:uncharacterized protein YeeX (DUF496 family)
MRKPHILKENRRNDIPEKIVFFDSESYVNTEISEEDIQKAEGGDKVVKKHRLYLIVGCFKGGRKREDWRTYTGDQEEIQWNFWKDVDSFSTKNKKTWVFAHNAKYDVLATGAISTLVDLGWTVTGFSDDNPFFIRLYHTLTKRQLVIISSTNYYKESLRDLGRTFGLAKMEIEYESCEVEKAIPYCRRDVEILKLAMEKFIEFVEHENLGNFSITIAGQAFNAYRHRFMEHEIYIHSYLNALKLEREAYAGGRTEAFRIGQINENVYYYDINSMYPYVMKTYHYPVRLLSHRKNISIDTLKSFIFDKHYLIIAKVKVNTDKPVFFKKTGKLIFPVGTFETVLSTPELLYALKWDMLEEVLEANIYEGAEIFKNYVDYFYTKRMEAKKQKNEVLTKLYKLFLNSLYGKFGEKNNHYEKIGEADPKIISVEKVYNADTDEFYYIKTFGGGIFRKNNDPDNMESMNSFPAIAAHVTAYARMKLWEVIETAGLENVYYCDTDSVFVNKEGSIRLIQAGLIDNYELGKLKLEKKSSGMEIYGVKDYVFCGKTKLKGVPKNAKKISENKYAVTVWRGISKYLKKGQLNEYENEVMIKELKRNYNKGQIYDEIVKPINYVNNEIILDPMSDNYYILDNEYIGQEKAKELQEK